MNACRAAILVCAINIAVGAVPQADPFRPEVLPIPTVTLTRDQVLRGELKGKPVTIAGELRIPEAATGRIPAVILLHGSNGMSDKEFRWAQEFNAIGIAAFLVDSFSGRRISNTVEDQTQLETLSVLVDAYRALGVLAAHDRIDPQRIAVMGFSKGAGAALYSSMERFRKLYAPPGIMFAAHIPLYPMCYWTYREDDKLTGKPVRLFHGVADDYTPITACRSYVERLKKAGADVNLTEYAGAYHGFDDFQPHDQLEPEFIPDALNASHCQLVERERGIVFNAQTGKRFDLRSDSCITRGAHVSYNEAAANLSVKAIKEFLTVTFKLPRS